MELMIPLKSHSGEPLYEQIYRYIKSEIKRGNLLSGTRLPSTRVLAEHLKVSRSTTQMAYEQLLSEGYIEAVPCRGYFVCGLDGLVEVVQEPPGVQDEIRDSRTSSWKVDFSPRGIDLDSFPFNTWRKISRNTLVDDNKELFLPGPAQGDLELREAVRSYLHSARGVNCRAEQIVVGAGNEYLLMLLYQLLGGQRVIAMENPTYRQAYRIFDSLGCRVAPVEMDSGGMQIGQLKESGADIAYIMPSHQYPMGIVMPVRRRQELLGWAYEKEGRYLIEDDYDSEFRYKGKPIPALQGMDRNGRVIYIGTFSQSIAPAIRISFMVLPIDLCRVYQERAGFYASTVSRIDQRVLYQFLSEGHYERHLNRMRAVYKAKHDALMAALKPLEGQFDIGGEYAGLHVLLTSREGLTEEDLIERGKALGVRVYGLSTYFIRPGSREQAGTVLLGYANLSVEDIKTGVRLLKEAWKSDKIIEKAAEEGNAFEPQI